MSNYLIELEFKKLYQALPRVSYIKAVDVWLCVSMVFVFGTLVEYATAQVTTNLLL